MSAAAPPSAARAAVRDGRTVADRVAAPFGATAAWTALAFLHVPMAVVVAYSFSGSTSAGSWGGFSTRWWEEMARNPAIRRAAANSLAVAGATALIAAALGTTLALGLHRRARRRSTAVLDSAILAPVLLPDVVQGVALLLAFVLAFGAIGRVTGAELTLGRGTIVCAHAAFASSYVCLLVRARLATIPRSLEEAALDLGATPIQVFRRIQLPLLLPAVVGGALLAFTLSLDEYVLSFFTSGPGSDTLPMWFASAARKGVTPEVNAVSAAMVLASAALAGAAMLVQRRRS